MNAVVFFSHYLVWHYTRAYHELFVLYTNFAWYITHLFSIPLLLRTLFSPWKRIMAEHKKRGLEDLAETITFNILSRVIGFLIRSVLVVIGVCMLVLVTAFFISVYVFWTVLPLLLVYLPLLGLSFLV